MSTVSIRDAVEPDLPAIVAIYNEAIPGRLATADLEPVTVGSRIPWFQAHGPDRLPLLVAANESGTILGWGSLNPFYGRPAYRHTAEISVYVGLQHARQGVGGQLTDALLTRSPRAGVKTLLAFIFGHNAPSIVLFTKRGFVPWGTLPRIAQMDDSERDLVIYGKRL